MTEREQKREAYFRLYWSDAIRWKIAAVCHACGLPDSTPLMEWDELTSRERLLIRAEIVKRLKVIQMTDFLAQFSADAKEVYHAQS